MADGEGSLPSGSSTSLPAAGTKTAKRKEYHAKRDATKVCLLESYERWKEVKKKHNFTKDVEVANMLLDCYEREISQRNREIW